MKTTRDIGYRLRRPASEPVFIPARPVGVRDHTHAGDDVAHGYGSNTVTANGGIGCSSLRYQPPEVLDEYHPQRDSDGPEPAMVSGSTS